MIIKKKIKKILICFILFVSIFGCLCFVSTKVKADTNIPNANSYMLNLGDIYLIMRESGIDINDFVGTTCITFTNQHYSFFKIRDIWFNRIYIQISIDYELTIFYLNSDTSQRADVVSDNNVIDFNALNINVPDLTSLNRLHYYLEASQGVSNLEPSSFFNILFTNVESSFPMRSGIYTFNFPDLFGIIQNIGVDYRVTLVESYNSIIWTYSYIIYSQSDIILTFYDRSTISCNIILIGGSSYDTLTFYFLKGDITNYTNLYYFDEPNNQFINDDYPTYFDIENIYFPYGSGIYELDSDEVVDLYPSDYVFNASFIFGNVTQVFSWDDFFVNIIDVPVLYLRSLTNFEIFGVNLFHTLTGILTTLLIIWIIRKF